MFKCEKCGESSEYLEYWQSSEVRYDFSVDPDGSGRYKQKEIEGGDDSTWYCPNCHDTVATTEEEAVELLTKEVKNEVLSSHNRS